MAAVVCEVGFESRESSRMVSLTSEKVRSVAIFSKISQYETAGEEVVRLRV